MLYLCAQFMLFFGGDVQPRVSLPCLIKLFGTAEFAPCCYAGSLAGREVLLAGLYASRSAFLLDCALPSCTLGLSPTAL